MSKSMIALLAAWTVVTAPVIAGEKTASQKVNSDPEVKRRGYLTPMEFINLCFKADKQQSNG